LGAEQPHLALGVEAIVEGDVAFHVGGIGSYRLHTTARKIQRVKVGKGQVGVVWETAASQAKGKGYGDERKIQSTGNLGRVDLDSLGIDSALRIAVNAQPADQVRANLAFRAPFVSLGGVIGGVVVFGARPAPRHFSPRRRVQELEFGLAQIGEASPCQSLEIVNRLPRTLRHHRHLSQQSLYHKPQTSGCAAGAIHQAEAGHDMGSLVSGG
jgi:hypothetical protein